MEIYHNVVIIGEEDNIHTYTQRDERTCMQLLTRGFKWKDYAHA